MPDSYSEKTLGSNGDGNDPGCTGPVGGNAPGGEVGAAGGGVGGNVGGGGGRTRAPGGKPVGPQWSHGRGGAGAHLVPQQPLNTGRAAAIVNKKAERRDINLPPYVPGRFPIVRRPARSAPDLPWFTPGKTLRAGTKTNDCADCAGTACRLSAPSR